MFHLVKHSIAPTLFSILLIAAFLLPTPTQAVHRTPRTRPVTAESLPIVPTINAQLKARLRAILQEGATRGNRATVIAKIGDSITESGSFLTEIGCGGESLGDHSALAEVINYFRSTALPSGSSSTWCGNQNSFTRASASAVAGWTVESALAEPDASHSECQNGENALACELRYLKPAVALIMYGTNDLESSTDTSDYRAGLTTIISQTLAAGVIPVLSTIPPRTDRADFGSRVAIYNQVIIDVAQAQQIPLWNYWRALQASSMINQGISDDGIHPSVYACNQGCLSADFSSEGLRYGYNQRNLTALQVLEKLKRVVLDDGAADSGGSNPATATATEQSTIEATATEGNNTDETATSTPTLAQAAASETASCSPSSPCRTHLPLIQGPAQSTPTPSATTQPLESDTPTATLPPSTPNPTTVTHTPTSTPASCSAIPAGAITLVTLGDSLTAGDGDENGNGGFAGRLLQRIQALRPGSVLNNLGRSGWSSTDLINGLNGEPSQLTQAITLLNQAREAGNPAIATLWIGSNDLWYLYEYENPSDARELEDAQNYSANLNTIVSQLRATGATVLVALLDDQSKRPVALAGQAFPGTSQAELTRMAQQVIRYNDAVRERATQQGATTVDFYNTTLFTEASTLAEDGNHPNAAGYTIITDRWFAAIEPRLNGCNGD